MPGQVTRAGTRFFESMLQRAGASVSSMASSEIYSALQTGALDLFWTSASSFSSYRLYEQVQSYTAPTRNSIYFAFLPIIIGAEQFNQLDRRAQTALEEASNEVQGFAYQASVEKQTEIVRRAQDAGVTIGYMDASAYGAWRTVAEPVWRGFASGVQGGQELIDLAQEVPA